MDTPFDTRSAFGAGCLKGFYSDGGSIRTELQPELARDARLLRPPNLARSAMRREISRQEDIASVRDLD